MPHWLNICFIDFLLVLTSRQGLLTIFAIAGNPPFLLSSMHRVHMAHNSQRLAVTSIKPTGNPPGVYRSVRITSHKSLILNAVACSIHASEPFKIPGLSCDVPVCDSTTRGTGRGTGAPAPQTWPI
ncbi:hypothetical protein LIA77_05731 [Sarocladium implicatum]|nr:hypothetical protein LIA77_05731 [Sarocladium implicatum]